MTTAYPLAWPFGWARTDAGRRKRAAFQGSTYGTYSDGSRSRRAVPLTVAEARKRLVGELERLGARELVLSSNLVLNVDGTPRSNQAEPRDPGVAAYFKLKGKDRVLACDRWDRAADNIAAIAKHIEAIRGIERWGVGTIEQAFTGYTQLPPPGAAARRHWQEVLAPGTAGLGERWTPETAETAYRRLLRERHPDRGGTNEQAAELNTAIAEAREELGA